jgi:formylmethanofuran dehydrogenase subunit E
MAIQYPCEKCSELHPLENLTLIHYNGKLMCPVCINSLIDALIAVIPDAIWEELEV